MDDQFLSNDYLNRLRSVSKLFRNPMHSGVRNLFDIDNGTLPLNLKTDRFIGFTYDRTWMTRGISPVASH